MIADSIASSFTGTWWRVHIGFFEIENGTEHTKPGLFNPYALLMFL
jgi:hypothetical protein